MKVQEQVKEYIISQPEPKRADMQALHQFMQQTLPNSKLWYDDGKHDDKKSATNPTIGYGQYTIKYANGTSREFFQTGISANQSGISVYILGIPDKAYLPEKYGSTLGKANVTGYCIKFKKLQDIHLDVLEKAVLDGAKISQG